MQVEERIGGKRTAPALIGAAVLATLLVALTLTTVLSQSRLPPAAAPQGADSYKVLWSRWTNGAPNTFRIRVRVFRQDHLPIASPLPSPQLVDLRTGSHPDLFQGRTYFENWTHHGPGNSIEVTVRARLATTPSLPVRLGFETLDPPIVAPTPSWARLLGPLYSPPPPARELMRLNGLPAILQPIAGPS